MSAVTRSCVSGAGSDDESDDAALGAGTVAGTDADTAQPVRASAARIGFVVRTPMEPSLSLLALKEAASLLFFDS